jgi:hypothetical protein
MLDELQELPEKTAIAVTFFITKAIQQKKLAVF